MKIINQFAELGNQFSRQSVPQKPQLPQLLLWNDGLAKQLGLNLNEAQKTAYFSGQQLLPGSQPVAMAYSGHQFGQFNPQLGDGRAHLLGELIDKHGQIQDLQLKGSGQTPFSRNGDGKCGIKPAVREYIMSEAMHALGVPTTRCLAVVTTGESIYRQTSTPGAVVTRVASSHLRVGTFEYFAARQMQAEIKTLADLTLTRHFPEIDQSNEIKYLDLLTQVIDKQIKLVTEWMRVGFIHGVMNTDNTLLSGATIDYGPCAMMGVYDPATVFSSIDHNGRYAFGNQAPIAQWNMARLAECLLPLIAEDQQQAIDMVMPLITGFTEKFNQAFKQMMANKLGFKQASDAVNDLQQQLLELMFKHQLDYTQTFVQLQDSLDLTADHPVTSIPKLHANLAQWQQTWCKLLQASDIKQADAKQCMQQHNPLVIPRNHHVEKILQQVETSGAADAVMPFLAVLKEPYSVTQNIGLYQDTSPNDDLNYQTFCGT
jgi:uncharacterized protein YdiU (UPF0061 family)